MGKYDHIDFKPPESAAKAAKRGLELRKKNKGKGGLSTGEASKQGIGSGVQRASDLSSRENLSPETVKRMKAFFDRHQKNKAPNKGTPKEKDKGYIAWLLWGGDPGYSWAKKVVKQMEAADEKAKKKKSEAKVDALFNYILLKEAGILSDIGHITLDIVGLIPGVGEVADATNALWHAKDGEYLYAALSLISCIPEIGDAIGKGGKLAAWVTETFPKAGKVAVKYAPEIVEKIRHTRGILKANKNLIDAVFEKASENEHLAPYVDQMKAALDEAVEKEVETVEDSPVTAEAFDEIINKIYGW